MLYFYTLLSLKKTQIFCLLLIKKYICEPKKKNRSLFIIVLNISLTLYSILLLSIDILYLQEIVNAFWCNSRIFYLFMFITVQYLPKRTLLMYLKLHLCQIIKEISIQSLVSYFTSFFCQSFNCSIHHLIIAYLSVL